MTNWVALFLRLCGVWFVWKAFTGVVDFYYAGRVLQPVPEPGNWNGWAMQHLTREYTPGTVDQISETIYSKIEWSIFMHLGLAAIFFFGCRWIAWIITRGIDPEFKK